MPTFADLYPFQMSMIKKLKFHPRCRFRDLHIDGLATDLQTFHIKQLIRQKLVVKDSSGVYLLTTKGKGYANRMDDEIKRIEQQGSSSVLVRVTRMEGGRQLFLVYKRHKEPFFGCVGFHTGKIKQGELAYEAAARELLEETGLTAELYFDGIIHYIDYSAEGEFIRDQFFYCFGGYNSLGKLKTSIEDGEENFWAEVKDLKKEKVYPGFWDKSGGLGWFLLPSKPKKVHPMILHETRRVIEGY
jgi:8-oxo-dGTP pyrophosphatase MutT (NUDIX family)